MKKALKTIVAVLCIFAILFPAGVVMVAATGTDTVPEGYTPIYTAKEFDNIRNNLSGKYILMNDIDLSSSWKPIGSTDEPFTGELDGNGYSVSDLKISGSYNSVEYLNFGLFTAMEGGSVRNLSLSVDIDVTFTGSAAVPFKAGAIAASADSVTVENCFVSGSINLDSFRKGSAGGLFGYVNTCSPKNCVNYASISLTTDYQMTDISVGGISGKTSVDTFTQCCNYGNITVTGYDITNASRKLYLGGIIGSASNVGGHIIKNCYNKGTIGLDCSTPSTYVGGITAVSYQTENCYNTGKIIIPENYMGLAGEISGNMLTGVSIGTGFYIKNVYYIDNGLYPSYNGGAVPGESDFENVKLLTEDEFKNQESFVGFDFETVWEMEENGYPVLQNQPEIPQSAISSGKCGDDVNYTFNMVTGDLRVYGSGEMDNYDTFSMFEWYSCAPWYFSSEFVQNVVIEDGVTSIGNCAFHNCKNMTDIDIPESVKSIGLGAFTSCYSLENIVIPEGVETIGHEAFYECAGLKTVSFPKTVTSLGDNCFYYCVSLENITVDSENPNFSSDEYGVLFNKDKTDLIHYPSGNKRTSYTVPESVLRIKTAAFAHAENLENIVFGNNLESIYMEAFMGCNGLKELTLPGSLERIGNHSFYNCTNIGSLTIQEGAKIIGSFAFAHCEAMNSISLPDSLEKIEMDAFEHTAFFENDANWANGALYCGKYLLAVKEDYEGKFVIKPGTRMIADYAVNRCKNITEVTIPDSMIIIGEGAFNMCSGLKGVTLPSSVTTLLGSTFRFCDSLVNVTIPETVTVMGNQVFYDCENLESVEIKAKVSTIGRSIFSGCTKLTSVKLPNTIKTIDEYAFRDCDSLETIVLPDGVEVIANYAFAYSPKLTEVNLPKSLTSIGYEAFSGTNINKITVPKNVSSISESAFYNTANLADFAVDKNNASFVYDGNALYSKDKTRLLCYFINNKNKVYVIDEKVTQIDRDAFDGNTHLERITVPESVTELDISFDGCTNLKSVAVDAKAKTIGTYMFDGCTSLEKVYFSSSVKEFYYRAFYRCPNISDIYFGGTEEEWNKISGVNKIADFENATIHYNHTHSHSLDAESEQTYEKYGYRLYSCECGHYYAEYDLVSKSDKYDVSATYHPDCFSEGITLDAELVTSDREPGGIYVVDGKTYIQVGVYNLKAVNDNGEVVQPNDGYTVKIKMAIPDEYKDKTDMVIYHRFVDGGREKLSTSDGTLVIQNGYMIFEISKFSEFEVLAGTAELSISKLPDKLKYRYRSNCLDLSGIQLKLTDIDGSVEYIDDTSKMTVEGFDSTKRGVQTVTVRYEEYTCTFEVEIYYTWWQWIIRILFFLWY